MVRIGITNTYGLAVGDRFCMTGRTGEFVIVAVRGDVLHLEKLTWWRRAWRWFRDRVRALRSGLR
jgi:hypothetical protein